MGLCIIEGGAGAGGGSGKVGVDKWTIEHVNTPKNTPITLLENIDFSKYNLLCIEENFYEGVYAYLENAYDIGNQRLFRIYHARDDNIRDVQSATSSDTPYIFRRFIQIENFNSVNNLTITNLNQDSAYFKQNNKIIIYGIKGEIKE